MEILGRNRLVLAAVVVAASLALSGVVLFLIVQDNGGEDFNGTTLEPSKQVLGSQSSHFRNHIASANSSTELNEPPMSSLELLNIACPDVHAELPIECIDALDEFVIDSVLPHWENRIDRLLHLGAPPSFDRVFEDPSTNRSLVLEALSREECRLEEGPIHPELHVHCNAEAIASIVLFIKYCMPSTTNYRNDWFGPMAGGLEIDRNLLLRVACRMIPFPDDDDATAFGQIEYLDLSPREFQVADELHTLAYEQELAR